MTIHVNGEPITEQAIQYELNRLVRFYSEHMPESEVLKQMDTLRRRARDQAIGARLLIDEANRLDIRVPPADVDARLAEMVRQAGGEPAFSRLLGQQKITREILRASIEQGRRVDLLVERIVDGVSEPTEEDMRAHYAAHIEEYTLPAEAQTQHILLRVDSDSAAERSVAISKLQGIRKKVEEGADFSDMAASYSDCPSGKRSGGSLGWISRGTMVTELDEAIFSLETGALSDVVETSLGFHLIRQTARQDSRPASYDEVREKIRDFLRHAARGEAIAAHVAELRHDAEIRIED